MQRGKASHIIFLPAASPPTVSVTTKWVASLPHVHRFSLISLTRGLRCRYRNWRRLKCSHQHIEAVVTQMVLALLHRIPIDPATPKAKTARHAPGVTPDLIFAEIAEVEFLRAHDCYPMVCGARRFHWTTASSTQAAVVCGPMQSSVSHRMVRPPRWKPVISTYGGCPQNGQGSNGVCSAFSLMDSALIWCQGFIVVIALLKLPCATVSAPYVLGLTTNQAPFDGHLTDHLGSSSEADASSSTPKVRCLVDRPRRCSLRRGFAEAA